MWVFDGVMGEEKQFEQRGRVWFCLAALYRRVVTFANATAGIVVLPI